MYEIEHHTKITRAICRYTDGSRADGKKLFQLPFPVMRFYVNFPAISHPEVASDVDTFTRLFLTNYCKALSNAFSNDNDFHIVMINSSLRALGGLHSSTPSVFFKKDRVSIPFENKYPVVINHRELAFSQPLKSLSLVQRYNLFFDFLANSKRNIKSHPFASGWLE